MIAEPEEEMGAYNIMPLASFETRQQQNQGVRRFSKTTKKEGMHAHQNEHCITINHGL